MILLVEPSQDLSEVVALALKQAGFDVLIAHTAEEAIKKAESNNLEAVVIELLMPRHNGLEFLYEFRSYGDWSDVPVIIYSQLSHEELGMNEALRKDLGVSAHLYKPTTSLSELVAQLKISLRTP